MRDTLALLATLLLLSGCTAAAPAPTVPTDIVDPDRPDPTFGDVAAGPAAEPDLNATTAAAPRLVAGEWWKIQFDSTFFPDTPEFLRVVADARPDGYIVGMPHEGWFKEALAYHAPGFGDIGPDLSYDMHDIRFEPVHFPLEKGASWVAHFGPTDFTATVEEADGTRAVVTFQQIQQDPKPEDALFALLSPLPGSDKMRLVYDAMQHEVVEFESVIGTWKVLEHGYGFHGWVTVPRGMHTEIDYGQFLTATPGEPTFTRTQTIQGGYNRLTLMQGVYALGPGTFRTTATGPDAKTYTTEVTATAAGLKLGFYEATKPDGEWTLEDRVLGPGGTYSMGMAYHQYDISLPDGARRVDHAHPVIR